MPHIFEEKHLATIDKLLKLDVSGSWYFRSEGQIADMFLHLDQIYEKGVTKNNGRPFNPKYRFHRTVGMDTQSPQVILQVLLPSSHVHTEELAGEIALNVELGAHGSIRMYVVPETTAERLAREGKWKASVAELNALNKLIDAARELEALKGKSFQVELHVGRAGVQVNSRYYNPADQVRAVLAKV
jgi:hypothetical protein